MRTYVGNGTNTVSGNASAPVVEDGTIKTLNEELPLQQFQTIMQNNSAQEMGVTIVEPQLVPQTKLENIIKAPVVAQTNTSAASTSSSLSEIVSVVVDKAKDFWTNLFKTVKLAGSLISRKYA